jgi:hypothetical protein
MKLRSIAVLAPQQNAGIFIADNSGFEPFINFSAISNVSVYSLRSARLSEKRLLRICLSRMKF